MLQYFAPGAGAISSLGKRGDVIVKFRAQEHKVVDRVLRSGASASQRFHGLGLGEVPVLAEWLVGRFGAPTSEDFQAAAQGRKVLQTGFTAVSMQIQIIGQHVSHAREGCL